MDSDVRVSTDHEEVVFRHDRRTGLKAIIAIHDLTLGPAAGGCRHWAYPSEAAGLEDALRLSRGMTLKNALADIPFGGGKSVILGVPGQALNELQLATFGDWIEDLQGRYVTAEDVGMRVADMRVVARRTGFISGVAAGAGIGGDPSPWTAKGVFLGMLAAVRHQLGVSGLAGVRVAVQGLGNVGYELCRLLHEAGAQLWVADIDSARAARAVADFAAVQLDSARIHAAPVEVFAPCALGGVLHQETIADLEARVVAGSANNQLLRPEHAALLAERGILYAPDYVINAGGVVSVAAEYLGRSGTGGRNWVASRIAGIPVRLEHIFEKAQADGATTDAVAEAKALAVLSDARQPAPALPGVQHA